MNNIEVQTETELNKLIQICHANLKRSSNCLDYLVSNRGISLNSIENFKIGYFPQNVGKLTQYVSPAILQRLNIIDYSEKSIFSEFFSLIFPIFSEDSSPIGIGGRTLLNDEERKIFNLSKYKNSSYKKSNYLYGLNYALDAIFQEKNVYVVEGFFDKIALEDHQIRNAVAICGTAFSKNHFLKLAKYTDMITFILDRDQAGILAMEKIYSKYCNLGVKLRFKLLPDSCKDVDEYFFNGGTKASLFSDLENYIPF